jgi:exodeoxyribonuclease-3
MRIDFILASPAVAGQVVHAEIARDERKTGKDRIGSPSDHAPVLIDLR